MYNKREFKKYISSVSQDICSYMMDVCVFVPGINEEEIHMAIITVLTAAESAVLKSNVKFDKSPKAFPAGGYAKARRAFYKSVFKKANEEFKQAVESAVKMFNTATPAEVREQNKQLLQGK